MAYGPANDQMVKLDFTQDKLIEVNNLKGFAIFLIYQNSIKITLMKIFSYILKKLIYAKSKNNNGKIYLDRQIKINHQVAVCK